MENVEDEDGNRKEDPSHEFSDPRGEPEAVAKASELGGTLVESLGISRIDHDSISIQGNDGPLFLNFHGECSDEKMMSGDLLSFLKNLQGTFQSSSSGDGDELFHFSDHFFTNVLVDEGWGIMMKKNPNRGAEALSQFLEFVRKEAKEYPEWMDFLLKMVKKEYDLDPPLEALVKAVEASDDPAVQVLLENGCPVDRPEEDINDHQSSHPQKHNQKDTVVEARPLLAAVKELDFDVVNILLSHVKKQKKSGTGQSFPPSLLTSALILACQKRSFKLVKLLLENGAPPDLDLTQNKEGLESKRPPLIISLRLMDTPSVKELISAGADINSKDGSHFGWSPIFTSLVHGKNKDIELLLDAGANLTHLRDDVGRSPLHYAVESGNKKAVELILELGVSPDIRSHDRMRGEEGMTAMHIAVRINHLSMAQFLMTHGADVNSKAELSESGKKLSVDFREDVGELKGMGIPLVSTSADGSEEGDTPLITAMKWGRFDIMKWLLKDTPVLPDIPGNNDWTALHVACILGNPEIANMVLEDEKVDIEPLTVEGYSPLHVACKFGNLAIVSLLLDYFNVRVNLVSNKHKTPLFLACQKYAGIVAAHEHHPRTVGSLPNSKSSDSLGLKEELTSTVTTSEGQRENGRTIQDQIQDQNQNEDFESKLSTYFNIAKMLLLRGADPNIADRKSVTPLGLVASIAHENLGIAKLVELISVHSANPMISPFESKEPISYSDSPLGRVVLAVVKAKKAVKHASSHVELGEKQENYLHFLKAAKELINHEEADLECPIFKNGQMSILSFIVLHEIQVLVQHPKVVRILNSKWGSLKSKKSVKGKHKKEEKKRGVKVNFVKSLKSLKSSTISLLPWKSRRGRFLGWAFLFALFLTSFCLVALRTQVKNDSHSWKLTQSFRDILVEDEILLSDTVGESGDVPYTFQDIVTVDQVWTWIDSLPDHFGSRIFNRFDKIQTSLQLRQLRVKKSKCSQFGAQILSSPTGDCFSHYSVSTEEKEEFSNFSFSKHSGATFRSRSNIFYPEDGGFVVDIPVGNSSEFRSVVSDLRLNSWIDDSTAVVMLEFVAFNANLKLVLLGRMIVEFHPSGKIDSTHDFIPFKLQLYSKSREDVLTVFLEIIVLLLFLIDFTSLMWLYIVDFREAIKQRWTLFETVWSILFWILICLRLWIVVRSFSTLDNLPESHDARNIFLELKAISDLREHEHSLLAIVAILLWFKVLMFLRIIPQIGVLLRIIVKMVENVVVFLLVFLVFLAGFSLGMHLLLGATSQPYRTWWISLLTLCRVTVGDIDFLEVFYSNNVVATLLLGAYVIGSTILLLNLLIAMLNQSYAEVEDRATSEYMIERANIIMKYDKKIDINMPFPKLGNRRLSSPLNEHPSLDRSKDTSGENDDDGDKDGLEMTSVEIDQGSTREFSDVTASPPASPTVPIAPFSGPPAPPPPKTTEKKSAGKNGAESAFQKSSDIPSPPTPPPIRPSSGKIRKSTSMKMARTVTGGKDEVIEEVTETLDSIEVIQSYELIVKGTNKKKENRHKWSLYLSEGAEKWVDCVIWRLHPSFKNPIVKCEEPPFTIRKVGWGSFTVKVRIVLKKELGLGEKGFIDTEHELIFDEQTGKNDRMKVTVVDIPKKVVKKEVVSVSEEPGDVKWEWAGDKIGQWNSYDKQTCGILEKSFKKGKKKVVLRHGWFAKWGGYLIDLKAMTQRRNRPWSQSETRIRNIRRVVGNSQSSTAPIPPPPPPPPPKTKGTKKVWKVNMDDTSPSVDTKPVKFFCGECNGKEAHFAFCSMSRLCKECGAISGHLTICSTYSQKQLQYQQALMIEMKEKLRKKEEVVKGTGEDNIDHELKIRKRKNVKEILKGDTTEERTSERESKESETEERKGEKGELIENQKGKSDQRGSQMSMDWQELEKIVGRVVKREIEMLSGEIRGINTQVERKVNRVKEEVVVELTRNNDVIKKTVKGLERRLPQTEFEYVYM